MGYTTCHLQALSAVTDCDVSDSELDVAKATAAKGNVKGVFTTEKVDTKAVTDSVKQE